MEELKPFLEDQISRICAQNGISVPVYGKKTGHQPNPSTEREFGDISTKPIDIEKLVRGISVKYVEEVNPYDVKSATKAMRSALEHDGGGGSPSSYSSTPVH